jgi:hypothetical protein
MRLNSTALADLFARVWVKIALTFNVNAASPKGRLFV